MLFHTLDFNFNLTFRIPMIPNIKLFSKQEIDWCKRHGLSYKRVRETHIMVEDTMRRLESNGYFTDRQTEGDRETPYDLTKMVAKDEKGYFDLLKFIIGAACYPHFYTASPGLQELNQSEKTFQIVKYLLRVY